MIIKNGKAPHKREIDLSGPKGNPFVLLGIAKDLGRQLGYNKKQHTELSTDMQSGDYDNLIKVFDEHFGMLVDLVLPTADDEDEEQYEDEE